jgi:hypothetical protein
MKKIKVICLLLVLALATSLCACNKQKEENQVVLNSQFGEFGYNGSTLTDYAIKTISANEAKELLPLSNNDESSEEGSALDKFEKGVLPSKVIREILTAYAGCYVTTEYYLDSFESVQTKTDKLVGTDFKNFLIENQFVPFNQLVAKIIVAYDELIDYMEEENKRFQTTEQGLVAPFKTIFSYHVNEEGNLIIQSRDFAEIASSVGGGVGCSYRQDTEIVYDAEGKMVLWQTSLGISTSAPQGTMRQGYILEMKVDWIEKV